MNAGGLRMKKRAMQRRIDELPLAFAASLARRSCGEKPDLPAVAWLRAGQEIGEEELRQAAVESLDTWLTRERARWQDEYEHRDSFRLMKDVCGIVSRVLGPQFVSDPRKLVDYLKDNRAVFEIPAFTKSRLVNAHTALGALLEAIE